METSFVLMAMAPPIGPLGNVVHALLVAGLAVALIRWRTGRPSAGWSIGLAAAVAVLGTVVLAIVMEATRPSNMQTDLLWGVLYGRSVLAAGIGVVSAAACLRPAGKPDRPVAASRRFAAAGTMLVAGTLAGAGFGLFLFVVMLLEPGVRADDVPEIVRTSGSVGLIAGSVGGVVLAGFAWCAPLRGVRPRTASRGLSKTSLPGRPF